MPGNHRKSHLRSLMEHSLDEPFCVGFQGENRQSFGSRLMSQAESFGSRLRDEKPQKAPRSGRHLGFLPHESSLHQDWVQELKMKVPFCPEGMLLSFISPTFLLPPRPSGSSPGSGAFICVLLPPWKHQVSGTGQLGRLSPWHSPSPSSSCSCMGSPRLLQVRKRQGGASCSCGKLGGAAAFPP